MWRHSFINVHRLEAMGTHPYAVVMRHVQISMPDVHARRLSNSLQKCAARQLHTFLLAANPSLLGANAGISLLEIF